MDDLRKDLKERGVRMAWVSPKNAKIDYSRLVGDGDPSLRRQISQELVNNIGLVPAEGRNDTLMEWYAATTGDWDKAVELYATQESPSPEQQSLAMSKASDMLLLGQPYPVTKDDVPETQLPIFIQIGDSLVQAAVQMGQFESQEKVNGLMAIGQHAMLLVQVLEQRNQKDLAQSFANEIQRISTEAQEPINNMLQAQEAQQDPRLAIDQQKLQLAVAKEDREERSFAHKAAKDQAQTLGKQRQASFNEVIQGRRLLVEEGRMELERQKAGQKTAIDQQKLLDARDKSQS